MYWLWTTIVTALAGVVLGAAASWHVVNGRAEQRERRLRHEAQEQHHQSTRKLRAANTRLQVELETERASVQQRVQSALAAQRTTTDRLEEQLRFAYAEIDRLKGFQPEKTTQDVVMGDDGFALTQPFTA